MLTIIPILLLLFAGFFVLLSGRLRLPTGQTWLVASITGFVAWILMILIRVIQPQGLVITTQISQTGFPGLTAFQFSPQNWMVGFLLVNLMLAVIFFEAQHLDVSDDSYLQTLAGSLILTAVGLLAIAAKTDRAFLLAWAIIDVLELSIIFIIIRDPERHKKAVSALFIRTLGLVCLFLVMILRGSVNWIESFGVIKNPITTFILLTVILRSGVLTRSPALLSDLHFRRGVGSLLRVVPVITAMVFGINSLPLSIPDGVSNFLLIFLSLCSMIAAIRWLTSRDELEGRPHWIFAILFLILIAALQNQPNAILSLGVLFLTIGPLLTLASSGIRPVRWLILFSTAAFLLLPYSPSSPLRVMFASADSFFVNLLALLTYILIILGIIRFAFRPVQEYTHQEKWMSFFHILGLALLAVMSWMAGVLMLKEISSLEKWWISIALILLVCSCWLLFLWRNQPGKKIALSILSRTHIRDPLVFIFQGAWQSAINGFFRSFWRFITDFFGLIQRVLEGDGGIFWSLLFLAILASLLISRQVP